MGLLTRSCDPLQPQGLLLSIEIVEVKAFIDQIFPSHLKNDILLPHLAELLTQLLDLGHGGVHLTRAGIRLWIISVLLVKRAEHVNVPLKCFTNLLTVNRLRRKQENYVRPFSSPIKNSYLDCRSWLCGRGCRHLGRSHPVLRHADLLLPGRHREDAAQLAVHQLVLVHLLPQRVLVDVAVRGEHGLDHELVLVLLRGVVLEGLQTDGDGHLVPGIHHARVGLHTISMEREIKMQENMRPLKLPLPFWGGCFDLETYFLVRRIF